MRLICSIDRFPEEREASVLLASEEWRISVGAQACGLAETGLADRGTLQRLVLWPRSAPACLRLGYAQPALA